MSGHDAPHQRSLGGGPERGHGKEREQLLAQKVFVSGENRPFGDIALADVRARADELREVAGWGPTMRVAPVARAWRELAMTMESSCVERVRELDAAVLAELAPRLGVSMPAAPMMR